MLIQYHRKFIKRFNRLTPKLQEKVNQKIEVFKVDPNEKSLKNHALKGEMSGQNSFSVKGDIRIIYEEHGDYSCILMLDVGKHAQVY